MFQKKIEKKILEKQKARLKLAGGSWKVAVGRGQVTGGS